IAIELERVKVLPVAGVVLVPMQDLRFGFDLELAQLLLQASDRARELTQIEFDRTELLFEARARDTDFAGVVEQLIEQLRTDAGHLDAIGGGDGLSAWRQQRGGRRQLARGERGLEELRERLPPRLKFERSGGVGRGQ